MAKEVCRPHPGAWIETGRYTISHEPDLCRPHPGAWIETWIIII